jgi:hypothetical protein
MRRYGRPLALIAILAAPSSLAMPSRAPDYFRSH